MDPVTEAAVPLRTRFLLWHLLAGTVLALAGLAGCDRALAVALQGSAYQDLWLFHGGTVLLDTVTAKDVSKFLPGLVLIACAAALSVPARTRASARGILFVGVVQLLSTLIAGVSKNLFGRLQPFEVLQAADWSHAWFVGGSSFPSGHAGFYFGLFLPLAWLLPRWRWPLVVIPWFIAVARVDANHHFISDIGVSIALASVLTLALARVLVRAEAAG
jgi:membrane-associated phospholipid phosphatase